MKDIKYLAAYTIPATACVALSFQGWWSYSTVIFAFGIIPLLEPFLPKSTTNLNEEEVQKRAADRFFDVLLYLNIPVVYGIITWFLVVVTAPSAELAFYEWLGLTLSIGIVIGACGINVAHELGHRQNNIEQLGAKLLLLPALYQHFFIEHNRGHHLNVATDLDPASARKGEAIYLFWLRSLLGSYWSAWQLETKRLKREGYSFWTLDNEMLVFHVMQGLYLFGVWAYFGWSGLWFALGIALVGVLLLETINYIEHYGLRRKKMTNGRYERVMPWHSWNANYELGRIILYELTRHSDHHYLASKKYQLLDHHDKAPELPLGYPGAMLMALVPPLWFWVMHKRIH